MPKKKFKRIVFPKLTKEQAAFQRKAAATGDVTDWYYDTYVVWGYDPLRLWTLERLRRLSPDYIAYQPPF